MNTPLITIIIPVYNVEPYLHRCLDSVINQTYKNLEIILIDDGSTDKSGDICDEYKKKDNRIIVIHQKNQGVSAARNAGLDIFKGDYVSFIDSDDYVDLRFVEKLYDNQIKYNSDISICGIVLIYSNKTFKIFNPLPAGKYYINQFFLDIFNSGSNKLFNSKFFDNERFIRGRTISEDAELVYRLLSKTKQVSGVGIPLYYYRQRSNSACNIKKKSSYYYDLDFLSKSLIYFCSYLSKKEINCQFRKCFKYFLKATKNDSGDINKQHKQDAILSYNAMLSLVSPQLDFKSKISLTFPNVCFFYLKVRFFLKNYIKIKKEKKYEKF